MPLPHTSAVVAPGPHDVRGRRNSPLLAQPPSNLPTAAISYNIRRQIRLSRLRRTLLALQTPIPPPPPPQLCSRHVPEPGCTPRGRGGEKRTCRRPHRTTYLPLCAGLPALTLQAATVARSRHTCGVVSCRFQGGPPTLAHDRSPERLDESRAPHLTSASTVAKFLCKTKKPQSEVVATQVKRKGGGKSHRLAATGPGRVACETTLGHGGMSPTIGGSRGASAASRHRGTATRGAARAAGWLKRMHADPT